MKIKTLLSLLSLCVLAGTAASAAPLEMNFQSLYNPAQKQNAEALEPWAASFAEKSKGEMVMHFFYTGGLVEPLAVPESIRTGMLDAAGWSPIDIKAHPYFYMASLPYLAKDQKHGYNIMQRLYAEVPEFKKDLDNVGVLLSMSASAPVAIASINTPINSPADLKGKRVLVTSSSFGEYVEAWGGIPVNVTMGDVYVGLQRGMGEMFICGVSCVKGARVQEFAKYMTVTGQAFTAPFPYSMNRDLFEKEMTPEQQKLTMEISAPLGMNVLNSFLADVNKTYDEFRAAGMEVTFPKEAEMAQFVDAAKDSVVKLWVRRLTDAGVPAPEKMIARYYEIAASTPVD